MDVNVKEKQKLQAVEKDSFRQSCRVSRLEHITNNRIKERSQIKVTIVEGQLIWFGHVIRMGEERLPRRAAEYHPLNRRKRGRPVHT